ncbi:MAG: hypothetical protein EHM63_06355 [Actinobacteria bacterium]|nr:MAG: hypothetical protein EHM63_06355 [Actinomycetota bacterium]
MCFSAEADVVAGLVVGAVGIDALRHVRRRAELPLAAIPVVLAAHQLIEAVIWRGLDDQVPSDVWRTALWVYLAIAFGVLPVLVPVAVGALEPLANRRRVAVFTAIGVTVAIVLMYAVIRGPIIATIEGHHIAYSVGLWHGGLLVFLYVVATCGSMLVSKHQHVRWFGMVNLVVVGFLAALNQSGLISLWCGWAAVTSVVIAVHLRRGHRTPSQLSAVPDGVSS